MFFHEILCNEGFQGKVDVRAIFKKQVHFILLLLFFNFSQAPIWKQLQKPQEQTGLHFSIAHCLMEALADSCPLSHRHDFSVVNCWSINFLASFVFFLWLLHMFLIAIEETKVSSMLSSCLIDICYSLRKLETAFEFLKKTCNISGALKSLSEAWESRGKGCNHWLQSSSC